MKAKVLAALLDKVTGVPNPEVVIKKGNSFAKLVISVEDGKAVISTGDVIEKPKKEQVTEAIAEVKEEVEEVKEIPKSKKVKKAKVKK